MVGSAGSPVGFSVKGSPPGVAAIVVCDGVSVLLVGSPPVPPGQMPGRLVGFVTGAVNRLAPVPVPVPWLVLAPGLTTGVELLGYSVDSFGLSLSVFDVVGAPVSGVAVSEVAVPGVAVPRVAVPEVAVLVVAVPGVEVPEVAVPVVPVVDVVVPGLSVPECAVPGVAEPGEGDPWPAEPVGVPVPV